MRLSFSTALFCGLSLCALAADAPKPPDSVTRAEKEIQRLRELVAAGAIAPARLQDAEQALADARDEAILDRSLYGRLTVQDLTQEQSREMVAAAERRLERQQQRLKHLEDMVNSGVLARGDLFATEQEMETRRLAVDLAHSRASLLDEISAMAHREQAIESTTLAPQPGGPVMEHFEGDKPFSSGDLKAVEQAYEKQFKRPLPISANGETEVHRALGFDHRGRVDVAVTPDQPEGVWLRAYLAKKEIPYYAFRAAVPGSATGAHIHIGPGSTRLRVAD